MSHHTPIDDPDLQRAYAALDQPAPSAALDAAILAAAHAAVQSQAEVTPFTPRPRRHWVAPLSLAASITLAVGIGWHMQQAGEGQLAEKTAEVVSAIDTPVRAGMTAEAQGADQANATSASVPAAIAPSSSRPAESALQRVTPAVSVDTAAEPRAAAKAPLQASARPEGVANARTAMADQAGESAELREQVATAPPPKPAYPERTIAPAPAPMMAAPPVAITAPVATETARKATLDKLEVSGARARQPLDFDQQIAQLRQWLTEGKTAEAEAGLKMLRQQWPDKPLPEDIRRWANAVENVRQRGGVGQNNHED